MADHHHQQQRDVIFLLFVLFSCLIKFGYGYQFIVGGRDGWVLNPSENYNHWAERTRFQVNDSLLFRYNNGTDSVVVVNRNDYDSCNTANPILKLDDGSSVFHFDHSGPFYFISGNKTSCDHGQKLIIVVLAVRNHPSPAAGAPAPATPPSSVTPATGAPTPAISPSSLSPAAGAPTPSGSSLSPSPATGAPAPAGSPLSSSPAGEPAINKSGPASANAFPGSPTAGRGGTPADVNSPGGSPGTVSAAAPCARPAILVVSFVLSVGLGGFMVSH